METVARQLEQLNQEATALTAEVKAAWEAYNCARAATTDAALALAKSPEDTQLQLLHDAAKEEERLALGRHEKLEKKEEQLLGDRRALQAKLHGTGERTLLLRCQRHQAVLNLRIGLWVKLSIM